MGYTGLVPSEYSSGGREAKGRIVSPRRAPSPQASNTCYGRRLRPRLAAERRIPRVAARRPATAARASRPR
jgi:hypothetical protein